ncbi:hypothetical protein [Parafrankia sp. EUN1f]|uniref:hypothetical protein n=1 Tax=Parafrankia sp. EUN1f TaxID=102897 RepID=UPI0001C45231|nr:hypothetical protein [Parafrankia sp. EUN1f]EFC82350.1 hypothetical protein FrEUN1fDRAFT_4514 [Parafrankia sp. EUN1f]
MTSSGEIPVDWVGDYLSPVHLGEPSGLAQADRVNPYYWYGSPIETQTDYVLQKPWRCRASRVPWSREETIALTWDMPVPGHGATGPPTSQRADMRI